MKPIISAYMASIGRRGGKKRRRTLSASEARRMVKVREARRAFRDFHASCFWSCDPCYAVTDDDVPWVAEQLMTYGGRRGWEIGAKLCR